MTTFSIRYIALSMCAAGALITTTAFGQTPAIQILDRVEAFDKTAVLDMNFDDPSEPDFSVLLNEAGADFKACKLTATRGIYCLDDDVVRNWPPGGGTGDSSPIVYCNDPTLGLRKCTGLTVDLGGTIWLAGQDRGKTHNLFKIEPFVDGSCPSSGDPLAFAPDDYCATLWAADKPLLIELKSVDGDTAASFAPPGFASPLKGVLGLEERKTAAYFIDNDNQDSVVIASGKRDWDLNGNEQLLSTALLQVVNPLTENIENYVLVTTTKDRILAAETDGTPDAREVFDIAAEPYRAGETCSPDDPMYGIQSSPKSGVTYVTDNQYCQVFALQPMFVDGVLDRLDNATDEAGDLTLPTDPYSVLGPTVAPGEIVDLGLCGDSCTIASVDGEPNAATLSGVQAVGDMILFQIEGIPDCRYIPDFCFGADSLGLDRAEVIIDRPLGGGHRAAQLLNVTPLLPLEVTEPFDGELPDMWISNNYQAQFEKGYFFDAFFGVTGATFQGVFEIEVEVAALTGGYERGCPSTTPDDNTPASVLIFGDPVGEPDMEKVVPGYDVVVKVSEDFQSIDRDYIESPDHEVMLINSGCGSSRGSGDRWSLIPFDLGFTPDTFDPVTGDVTPDDPAVFATLLLSLFDDLEQSVNDFACPVLSNGQCMDFNQQLANTLDKLEKCMDATIQPKDSSRNQTCQAFSTQFGSLQSVVSSFTPAGQDPANRIGEVRVRIIVIDNVYTNLFFPSIPDDGFGSIVGF